MTSDVPDSRHRKPSGLRVVWFTAGAGALLLALTLHMRWQDEARVELYASLIKSQREVINAFRQQRDYALGQLEARPIQTRTVTVYYPCAQVPRPIPRELPVLYSSMFGPQ